MSALPRTMIKLAAAFVEHQAKKNLGDEALSLLGNVLADYAGEKTLDKLVDFVQQGDRAEKLVEAFKEADQCFAETCGDPMLKQAIAMMPLAEIPSLEKLAAALPETLDDAGLLAALRQRFEDDWRNALTPEQLDRAASVYRACLDRPLAAKCNQLLETLFRKVERIEKTTERTEEKVNELLIGQKKIELLLIDAANLNQLGPRDWVRPTAPRPSREMVGRRDEFDAVRALLQPGERAAITATVQGTPGVGKTLLAEHLAAELDSQFPGGVLFERLGFGFRDPGLAAPVLDRWGGWAYGNRPLPEGLHLTPEAVRAALAGHGAILVVLDDVWSLDAIKPLQEALPNEACLLITTRSEKLARDLRGKVYPLNVLNEADALALLRERSGKAVEADQPLLERLAKALGRHAQALDIAGGSLSRRGRADWPQAVETMARQVEEGTGFGELNFPREEVRVSAVETALQFSYEDLAEAARQRFRSLGAFAPDASFNLAVALLWQCEPDEAEGQLTVFVERGLLTRIEALTPSPLPKGEGAGGEGRWQQHSLLRAYALALLRRGDEEAEARERQARAYLSLMHDLDEAQQFYRLLPDYAQLKHAFEWAIVNSLSLALALAGETANLQAAFYFVRDNYDWAGRIAGRAKDSDSMEMKGAALVTLANALSRLATLPNEDRPARLHQSLTAYDEALKYRRPDTAPLAYAMTQNNRATLLSELASLPGEDRRARLEASLAAYDEALKHYRPDTAPLAYAMTQNNRATLLSELASLPGEDRRARLEASLAAYDEALKYRRPDTAPLAYAMTQNNRATLLSELASLPGEDRRARLEASLAAYDEALKYRRPDTAPLAYAMTQNNRATLLSELASLPGEDRRARLEASLAAYDEALKYRRPDTAPLAYAMTQNNRALLSELASLPGEDRRARLEASLAAYDEALKHYRPDTAPLAYAMTQNNRATLLSELASLPGEDRRARLEASLAAYDEALKYRRPDTAPLAYAMTQNNRATLLSELASLPGEDRRARLEASLAAYDEALKYRRPDTAPLAYAMTQNNRATLLSELASLPGEDRRARLEASLAAYDEALKYRRPDTAPLDYAMTQSNLANLFRAFANLPEEDRRAHLLNALRCALTALSLFEQLGHAPYAQQAAGQLRQLSEEAGELFPELWAELKVGEPPEWLVSTPERALTQSIADFINAPSLARMREIAEANPALSTDQIEPIFAGLLEQYRENEGAVAQITQRLQLLRACRENGVAAVFEALERAQSGAVQMESLPEDLRRALGIFVEARQHAEEAKSAEAWQAAALAGQALLDQPEASQLPLAIDQLRDDVANDWNNSGNILSEQEKHVEALVAYSEAIKLQPDKAMWHRNHTGTLIELGDFAAAGAGLARAEELEPEHPRLAELRKELEEKRRIGGS